jgi:hypothetical protein
MKKCTKCLEIQPLSNFSKNGKKFGIRSNCKKCDYNRKNKFLSTERGFLEAIYRNMINRKEASDNGSNRGKVYAVEFTFEELINKWNDHKLKYGQNCIYTGEPIFHERNKNQIRGNQISIDRLDNNKPYILDNIVFCSSRANWIKGQITIDMCKKVLEIYNEK